MKSCITAHICNLTSWKAEAEGLTESVAILDYRVRPYLNNWGGDERRGIPAHDTMQLAYRYEAQ